MTNKLKIFIFVKKIMNALLLSAGLGTRLRPLTNNIPKALIEVNNEPILKLNLDKLYKFGISRVIVNVHYLSDKIIDYIKNYLIQIWKL